MATERIDPPAAASRARRVAVCLMLGVCCVIGLSVLSDWFLPATGPLSIEAPDPPPHMMGGGSVITERDPAATMANSAPSTAAPERILCTFLHGVPMATVLLRADTPRTSGVPFASRARSTRHVVAESGTREDDMVALCCEGAYVRTVQLRSLPSGETRIDLVPARALRIELVNVAPGLHDVTTLAALIGFAHDESPLERFARVSMSAGVLPIVFDRSNACEAPMFVDRGGEVTVTANAKEGGPGYSVKKEFRATEHVVQIDVSSLAFCMTLVDFEVVLDFPYEQPVGKLRLALFDGNRSCLVSAVAQRATEATLNLPFHGIQPGRYVPELQLEDGLSIRLAEIDVPSASQPIRRVVVAASQVDVIVASADSDEIRESRVVVHDDAGRVLGDPARRGERAGLFLLRRLPAGVYFVQVLCEDRALASAVTRVTVGESETQQMGTTLQAAGAVDVTRKRADGGVAHLDLIATDGSTSRFFVPARGRRVWCPIGPYTVLSGAERFSLDIRVGSPASVKIE